MTFYGIVILSCDLCVFSIKVWFLGSNARAVQTTICHAVVRGVGTCLPATACLCGLCRVQKKNHFFTVACSMQGIITPSLMQPSFTDESQAPRFDGSAFYSYCVHAGAVGRRGSQGRGRMSYRIFLSHAHQRFSYRFFSCRDTFLSQYISVFWL